MTRTGWSMVVAAALIVVSVAIAVTRRYALGPELDGTDAGRTWRVTLVATGELGPQDPGVTVGLVPDFRNQHVTDEHFASKDLAVPRAGREKDNRVKRDVMFRRNGGPPRLAFRIDYSFHVQSGVRKPTPEMVIQTLELDGPPVGPATLQPSQLIESTAPEIRVLSDEIAQMARTEDQLSDLAVIETAFKHVAKLPTDPARSLPVSARDCLHAGRGDSGGKARLLVALCRSRGIPARLVSGVVRAAGQDQPLHQWAEAWVNQRWVPMCPTRHHFDGARMTGYLVLHIGDDELARCRVPVQYGFIVHAPRAPESHVEEHEAFLHKFWEWFSLDGLSRGERRLVKFLLLLPLAALIVSFIRTIIGVPTFGTFSPALLGLAFLDLKTLHWGLGIFVLIVLVGWGMRRWLEGFHLLQVPRTSALLTLIVTLLIVVIVAASHSQIAATQYISLFPLVILTHLVERFWTVEAEDGTASSFKTLLGTMLVAATVSVCLAPDVVSRWVFRYPETLGVVLAAQFLLGRYTGYRLVELYRFGDLILEEDGLPVETGSLRNGETPGLASTRENSRTNGSATHPVASERERQP